MQRIADEKMAASHTETAFCDWDATSEAKMGEPQNRDWSSIGDQVKCALLNYPYPDVTLRDKGSKVITAVRTGRIADQHTKHTQLQNASDYACKDVL